MDTEVYALVGASGTGKSHRASLVAMELGADLVIDDGLLIRDGKILAGRSAKRESTRVAAVRRALFSDPADVQVAREALAGARASRILVLGTSRAMVRRIADALGLPEPIRYINISDVSSSIEINRARRIRSEQGKHVIPVPTLEVKRSFSGYLVDPIRFFLRVKGQMEEDLVIEKSVVRPTFSSLGKFFISDTVVAGIAGRAAQETAGVNRPLRVTVEARPDGVDVTLELVVNYGRPLVPLLAETQARVREVLEYTTALNVLSVNVVARKMVVDRGETLDEDPGRG